MHIVILSYLLPEVIRAISIIIEDTQYIAFNSLYNLSESEKESFIERIKGQDKPTEQNGFNGALVELSEKSG